MIDLKDVTFIIPIRLESYDRRINLEIILRYLNINFDTNIIVYESDMIPRAKNICSIFKNVQYVFNEDKDMCFHRTKFLNIMLDMVKTKVVINYDTDILLPLDTYTECIDLIRNDTYDLVYPYFQGKSQRKVHYEGRDLFSESLSLDTIPEENITECLSMCGHCQIFNTESYIRGGMENEDFISYDSEDVERMYRFEKLGYRVHWFESIVYHLEHSRTQNSNQTNKFFEHNCEALEKIQALSKEELEEYYNNAEYLKKYNNSKVFNNNNK